MQAKQSDVRCNWASCSANDADLLQARQHPLRYEYGPHLRTAFPQGSLGILPILSCWLMQLGPGQEAAWVPSWCTLTRGSRSTGPLGVQTLRRGWGSGANSWMVMTSIYFNLLSWGSATVSADVSSTQWVSELKHLRRSNLPLKGYDATRMMGEPFLLLLGRVVSAKGIWSLSISVLYLLRPFAVSDFGNLVRHFLLKQSYIQILLVT